MRETLAPVEADDFPLLEVLGEKLTVSVAKEVLEREVVEQGVRVLLEQREDVGERADEGELRALMLTLGEPVGEWFSVYDSVLLPEPALDVETEGD